MAFLLNTLNLIKGVFGRPMSTQTQSHHDTDNVTAPEAARHFLFRTAKSAPKPSEKCEEWLTQLSRPNKRKALEEIDGNAHKKGRTVSDRPTIEQQVQSSTLQQSDRDLMPPPATPPARKTTPNYSESKKRESQEWHDTTSEARTHRSAFTEADDEQQMEAARRRAAATQLPPNSGVWEPAEQDLFYHLAYRGLEPLLPRNWMVDFPTLPLSLFARETNDVPLIQLHRSTDFRGIKALREVMDIGKIVRDQALSTGVEPRSEPKIAKAVNRYIKWTMKDVGIASKDCIPVHAVVAMQQGQSTRDVIRELTLKMHKLSSRHREDCSVLTSIEQDEVPLDANGDARLHDDQLNDEQQLPVIYGLIICSSLIGVFTLSSHTSPPTFVRRQLAIRRNVTTAQDNDGDEDADDENEDSGLRFIASFDFSDSAADVWNAFVVVILATMIRKTLTETYEISVDCNVQDYDESIMDSSLIDGDGDGPLQAA